MEAILAKLIASCVSEDNQKLVREMISNEKFHYIQLRHGTVFMYGGRLRTVQFKYKGYSVESVLDRLPTAKILSEEPTDGDPERTAYTTS